jgi:hypothetical protein
MPDGEKRLGKGGCLDKAETAGYRKAMTGRRQRKLRVAAAIGQRTDLIAHGPAFYLAAQCGDRTRDLQPRNVAMPWRRAASALIDIVPVYPGSMDLD